MWLASVLEWAAAVCMALSVPLMLWQLGVGIMGLFSVRKLRKLEDKTYRFAVVSCARNEEAVIGQLLDSLQNQRYPRECFDLFVIADNCTDDTAAVARKHGAIVLERQDKGHIGKGYALRWAFERIIGRWGDRYDAVVLFDADNLADPDFLLQTNEALCSGADVTQGYRAGKNPDASWVSGCYTLYWLGLMRFFYCARRNWGLSAQVGGTGFAFKTAAIRGDGWNTTTITEDGEFSVQQILAGNRIVPVREAVFYDEQPVTFAMSLRQRHRWVIGGMQIARRYLKEAFRCFARGELVGAGRRHVYAAAARPGPGHLFGAAGTIASALHAMTAPGRGRGLRRFFPAGLPGHPGDRPPHRFAGAGADQENVEIGAAVPGVYAAHVLSGAGGAFPAAGGVEAHRPYRSADDFRCFPQWGLTGGPNDMIAEG